MRPLISILIPSYNYLHYITKAIDTSLAQTYPNIEVVVADNCSTDGTVPALRERYGSDPRVRIYENETNLGMIGNSNRLFEHARGEYVLWLSADDWFLPRHLERLYAVFERAPQLDVVYSGAYFADKDERVWGLRQLAGQFPYEYVDARDELVEMLTTVCPLCWPTALFRSAVFEDVGLCSPDGPFAADWELQVRLALFGKRFAYLPDASMVVRIHGAQATGREYHETGRNIADFIQIVEMYFDHPGMERIRGRERAVAALLDGLISIYNQTPGAVPLAAELQERARSIRARLLARAERYEPARVRSATISVIIPARGALQATLRAVDAAANQTRENVEIVVLDQGAIPAGPLLSAHPAAERIACIRIPVPQTPGVLWNLGLRLARGEYIAFLPSDDVIAPDHLATLAMLIDATGGYVAATRAGLSVELTDQRQMVFQPVGEAPGLFRGASDPDGLRLVADALPLVAVLMHRSIPDRVGRFNEQTPLLEGYEFLLRVGQNFPIAHSDAATARVTARLNFAGDARAALYGNYLPILDNIYASYPVSGPLVEQRAAHRAAAADVLARGADLGTQAATMVEFNAALAGRRVFPALAPSSR